jgi:transcriptional regulator with XRE-family HTH domain
MRGLKRRPSAQPPPTRCRIRRLELGWSQDHLAELTGVPQPYISLIEHRRDGIHQDDLKAVGKALGLDPDKLMELVN